MQTIKEFQSELIKDAEGMYNDSQLQDDAFSALVRADRHRWIHQTNFAGIPALQLPQDLFAMQEIIFKTKPQVIVELGVAWGGTTMFFESFHQGDIIGVDLQIPDHLRDATAFKGNIRFLIGDSVFSAEVVKKFVGDRSCMVIVDSMHTHKHVLEELNAFSDIVTPGCYMVVCDTLVDDPRYHEDGAARNRPWGPGNSPRSALNQFLEENPDFERDENIRNKLLFSCQPDGYIYKK
tara:strand:- start:4073 stop:4780 length:708 start_codon:yes stop_codon:yes gene_type:complete